MNRSETTSKRITLPLPLAGLLLAGMAMWSSPVVLANHPVLVEGNQCADGAPGTTLVPPRTCGDYDGDGRIGTAEDTDNADDRIFGTINAAIGNTDLGPDINATRANQNGRVLIVTSGRFRERVLITGANGNVTLEAAPGVDADIDAVVQGLANNVAAQGVPGITVNAPDNRRVTIRNIMSRNWTKGIEVLGNSHVTIDKCRLENNRDYGVHVLDTAKVAITNTQVNASGFREAPIVDNTPNPGIGIAFEGNHSEGTVAFTTVTGSFFAGIANSTGGPISLFHVVVFDNNPNLLGGFHIE